MASIWGNITLFTAHELGDRFGGIRIADPEKLVRCEQSLPALQSLEDGREITNGLECSMQGILRSKEASPDRVLEPGPRSSWMSIPRDAERRFQLVSILADAGGFLARVRALAQTILQAHIEVAAPRGHWEAPRVTKFDEQLMQKAPLLIKALQLTSRVRWCLQRLSLEVQHILPPHQLDNNGVQSLRREVGSSVAVWGEGSGNQFVPMPAAVTPPEPPNVNLRSFGRWVKQDGQTVFQQSRWTRNVTLALHREELGRIKQLCATAFLLWNEGKKFEGRPPYLQLRCAIQGEPLAVAPRATLQAWQTQVRLSKKTEQKRKELFDALALILQIEGPKWRSRAVVAEVFLEPDMGHLEEAPQHFTVRERGRSIQLSVREARERYWRLQPTQRQTGEQFWYIVPCFGALDRGRILLRQQMRRVDFPRPSLWEPIAEGGWKTCADLRPLNTLQGSIRNPRSVADQLVEDSWMLMVDRWRTGQCLPARFETQEMYLENRGNYGEVVWLTPDGPIAYEPRVWEELVSAVLDWMGENAYLNMAARLGWGHVPETELLAHIAGYSLFDPERVGPILEEMRGHFNESWRLWIVARQAEIDAMMRMGCDRAYAELCQHYLGASDPNRRTSLYEQIAHAAVERIRLFGPCTNFLPRAFKRVPFLVAQSLQLSLRRPLEAVRSAFDESALGLEPGSSKFSRAMERCRVASEIDLRTIRQLFSQIYVCEPVVRQQISRILKRRSQDLTRDPQLLQVYLRDAGVHVEADVCRMLIRQLGMITRASFTQPNEAAIAARAWEEPV